MSIEKSIESLTFEQAILELEDIVRKIESGGQDLNLAISSFERGVLLKSYCERQLNEAKLKIEKITKDMEGNITTEDLTIKN